MNLSRYLLAPYALASLLAPASAVAEQRAEKIAITPSSQNAAIIFKSAQIPVPPSKESGYRLEIGLYDPVAGVMKGVFGGGRSIGARPKLFYNGYLVSDIKPGTYVIGAFSRQDNWILCFNGASRSFSIGPGEVLYLGDFDAIAHLAELELMTTETGQITTTTNRPVQFFDTVTPPRFTEVNSSELTAVAEMMRQDMPLTTVAPKAVTFSPAKFGTGSDLFGLQRMCGGWHRKGAKQ